MTEPATRAGRSFDIAGDALTLKMANVMKKLARSMATSARAIISETSTVAVGHVDNLRSQLENLWSMAEDFSPRQTSADLLDGAEQMLANLRTWKMRGFPGEFYTGLPLRHPQPI